MKVSARWLVGCLLLALPAAGCSSGPTSAERRHQALTAFAQRVVPRLSTATTAVGEVAPLLNAAQRTDYISLTTLFNPVLEDLANAAHALDGVREPTNLRSDLAALRTDVSDISGDLQGVQAFVAGTNPLGAGEPSVIGLQSAVTSFQQDRVRLLDAIGRQGQPQPSSAVVPIATATPGSPQANPVQTLGDLVAFDPQGTFVSRPVDTPIGQVAVVARPTSGNSYIAIIDVAVHGTDGWRVAAVLGRGEDLAQPFIRPTPIHVTTSLLPDFEVPTAGADYTPTVIVSDVGGTWHLVHFHGDTPGSNWIGMGDVVVSGSALSTSANNCSPDCAEGTNVTTSWRFYPPEGDFTPTG